MSNAIIPENKKGKALDLEYTVTTENITEAVCRFNLACSRLLNPAVWHQMTGAASASFMLVAEEASKPAQANDHIQIDIPGPGTSAGKGYDWVQIEMIAQDVNSAADESLGMKLRACADPNNKNESVAHFFTADATSTFIISRTGNSITTTYSGRNEVPNTTAVNFIDKLRNGIVAAGAMAALSEMHWQAFIKGLLENTIQE